MTFEEGMKLAADKKRAAEEAVDSKLFRSKVYPDKNITNASGQGNAGAGMLISKAGGSDPLAQGLAAGVSTGNPLVGIGMGVIGGIQGAQKEKQRKADIDAKSLIQQANNEQNTQIRRSAAIQSLAQNLSNSLLR